MAAVSLAMPTKLWDSVGRECGRTFLYLQFSLLTAHLVPIIARTRLWPLQRFTVGRLAVVAVVGTVDDGVGGL